MPKKETTEEIAFELVVLCFALVWTIGAGLLKLGWLLAKTLYNRAR